MQNLPPDSILSTFTAKSFTKKKKKIKNKKLPFFIIITIKGNFFKVQAHKKYFKYKCTLSPLEKSDD